MGQAGTGSSAVHVAARLGDTSEMAVTQIRCCSCCTVAAFKDTGLAAIHRLIRLSWLTSVMEISKYDSGLVARFQ